MRIATNEIGHHQVIHLEFPDTSKITDQMRHQSLNILLVAINVVFYLRPKAPVKTEADAERLSRMAFAQHEAFAACAITFLNAPDDVLAQIRPEWEQTLKDAFAAANMGIESGVDIDATRGRTGH